MAGERHGHGMLCVNLHLKCAKLHTQVLRRVSTNKGSDTVFSPKEHKTRSSTQRLERPCAYKSLYKCEPKRRFTHSAYDTLDVKQTVWHPHTSLVCWWTSCRHLVLLASRWFINHYDHSNKSEIIKWIDHTHTHTHTHKHTNKRTNTNTPVEQYSQVGE